MNATTDKNPIVWVLMQNAVILGAYSRPEWTAYAIDEQLRAQQDLVRSRLNVEHHEFAPYVLSDGYTGECDLEFTYNPTVEQIEALILERTDVMGVTVAGIDQTAYALNICPVLLDA